MNFKTIIKENNLNHLFNEGIFGIEREALRTEKNKNLAVTKQPKILGRRAHHPYLLTDFSESQPELVTPPVKGLTETFRWLKALHDVYLRSIEEEEYLWPFSMPNVLPEDDDQIPIIDVPEKFEIEYRKYLAQHYGKKLQMISGMHFNFSFTEEFVQKLYENQTKYSTKLEIQNELYLKLARNFLRYRWFITYLFGAAPYADKSFFISEEYPKTPLTDYMRSIRNSDYGYHNPKGVEVRYDSLKDYVDSIEKFVQQGAISEEREFYGDARFRGKGKYVREMNQSGISYVEFRNIDVNPFSEYGLSFDESKFIQLFFMTIIWVEKNADQDDIRLGNDYNIKVASENPFEKTVLYDEGLEIIESMKEMVAELHLEQDYENLIKRASDLFEDPSKTYAARIVTEIEEESCSYLDLGERLGLKYKSKAYEKPFLLRGFETMELSTQLLIFDSIQRGLKVEILDEKDHFLRLSYGDHEEYVKNGNMTSKDTYISHWLMANKTVTKKVLKEDGFEVPGGNEYQTIEEALNDFAKYKSIPFVVKPKSTNFGVGISIFKNTPNKDSFEEALEIAFKEDDSVLVEEFIEGTEYRFFVLNDKTEAVLLRVPANIVGDGESTISELVDEKNKDNLRGTDHRAPMEKIVKSDLEILMLKEQGYDFESIPEKDETVYLRENSNISTGGDSIDFTDEMSESYKNIAEDIAKSLDVKVTGIDLIIPDYTIDSTKEIPGYSAIEANFNPAMNMHSYVHKGKGRRLTQKIIDMLFPELPERL